MSDLISRQAAIDALVAETIYTKEELKEYYEANSHRDEWVNGIYDAVEVIEQLPPAPLAPDQNCDLWITVPDIDKVTRIYVQESKSKFCRIFYEEQPERIIHCKDCKHWIPYDWMFSEVWQSKNMADYPEDEIGCNWCDMAMKANDFCSRAERREVTT